LKVGSASSENGGEAPPLKRLAAKAKRRLTARETILFFVIKGDKGKAIDSRFLLHIVLILRKLYSREGENGKTPFLEKRKQHNKYFILNI